MKMPHLQVHLEGDVINDLDIEQKIGSGEWAAALNSGSPVRLDFNLSGVPTLTGIAKIPDGTVLYLRNTQPFGGNSLFIASLSGSQAGNQFSLPTYDFTLHPQQCVICVKDDGVLTISS